MNGFSRQVLIGGLGAVVGALIIATFGAFWGWFKTTIEIQVPPDSIIAFDSDTCPKNWQNVGITDPKKFAGRVFVVSGPAVGSEERDGKGGTLAREYGSTSSGAGGTEFTILTENHIPRHDHSNDAYSLVLYMNGRGTVKDTDNSGSDEANLQSSKPLKSFGVVNPTPIDNMQPFIAMTFCKKTSKS